ncbi:MAG TPA: hypothetical protein VMY18_04440, partial [Acidobacteriota bacterium]|nr:hypothetical protein [Acidobacteriota bacterium]
MFRLKRKILLNFWLTLSVAAWTSSLMAQDLTLRVGQESHRVEAATRDGKLYFRLRDIAAVFELSTNETSSQIDILGPRGTLALLADRPLVRIGDQYILLTGPVWRRGKGNWFVPADFLEKVLPGILNTRLTKESDGTYRVQGVGRNSVRVEFLNYPDHLSLVFRSSRAGVTTVQEFRDYIEVRYGEYLVNADSIADPPDRGLITSVTFVPEEAYGTFRV